MSGTSVDGIDIACADLDLIGDELACAYRGLYSTQFSPGLRDRIVAALPPGAPPAGELCRLHVQLGDAYAAAFEAALGEIGGCCAGLAVLHGLGSICAGSGPLVLPEPAAAAPRFLRMSVVPA